MTNKALLAGIPLGVLATGMMAGTAYAQSGTTTQTFDYYLGNPYPSDESTSTPNSFQVAIGGATAQYSYQYGYDPFGSATPKLATQGNALINPVIFHDDSLPMNNETFESFPNDTGDPKDQGTPTGPSTAPKDLSSSAPGDGLFTTLAVSSDNYLHLKFDIGNTSYLGSAHFSSDGQTLYDITYAAADGTAPAVPEPAVWAELVLGFGAIGGLARTQRRRRQRDLALAA